MQRHSEAGHAVVMVSASFEPIVREAMRNHCIYAQVSTRMQVDVHGCYTNKVDGAPVQGCEKALAITRLCDELFGPDKWELDWAYGDHHSALAPAIAGARTFGRDPRQAFAPHRQSGRVGDFRLEYREITCEGGSG